jgi:hypothetical protein
MQFNILLLCLYLTEVAISIPYRLTTRQVTSGVTTLEDSFRGAGTALESLENELKTWRIGTSASDITHAVQTQQRVIDELRLGSREIRRGGTISLAQSVSHLNWVNTFSNIMGSTMSAWISLKNVVTAARQQPTVLSSLLDLSEARPQSSFKLIK